MEKDVIKNKYVIKEVVIDKDNYKTIFKNDVKTSRYIRKAKVASLKESINLGKHFQSIFVINNIDGKNIIIDGNHRYEAIKQAITKNKSVKIKVFYAEYKNLDKFEFAEIFKLWNIGTKQTGEDFIKVNINNIPLGKTILKDVPCTIYHSQNKFQLKMLVSGYSQAKRQTKFSGGVTRSGFSIVKELKEITKDDIKKLVEFREFMFYCFGTQDPKNKYYKAIMICPLLRVWYDNRHITKDIIKKGLMACFDKPANKFKWETLIKMTGREASVLIYEEIMKDLGKKSGKNGFIGTKFSRTIIKNV